MVFVLTAGQRHEQSVFKAVMKQGTIKRQGGGGPKLRPKRVVAEKGYNSGKIRGTYDGEASGSSSLVSVISSVAVRSTSCGSNSATG